MVMIDSKGQVHVVGKNPHLITITPERSDNILQVNDILSIGRRDREPWMRLQVLRKPDNGKQATPRKSKTTLESVAKESGKIKSNCYSTKNNRQNSSPPEWITTTRKRKISSKYSTSKQQRPLSNLTEGIYESVNDNTHQSLDNNLDYDSHQRKRRRRRENSDIKPSRGSLRERNQRRSLEENPAVSAARAADHIHLVFQDYEISAILVKATQRKGKEKRSKKSEAANNNTLETNARNNFTDKSQSRLFSQNFARALSSTNNDQLADSNISSTPAILPITVQYSQPLCSKNANSMPADESKERDEQQQGATDVGVKQQEKITVIADQILSRTPGNFETDVTTNKKSKYDRREKSKGPEFCNNSESMTIIPTHTYGISEGDSRASGSKTYIQQHESSMLSLPQCASSNFTLSLEEGHRPVINSEPKKFTHNSDTLQTSEDPNTCLDYWKNIIEKEKGNPSSFRHALANLIVTKNREYSKHMSLWLPDLLEDGSQG
jgi:hypothetical protein